MSETPRPLERRRAGPTRPGGGTKRLRDRVEPPVRVLFVGINPGVRSAAVGHHFAGYSNRFWRLLFDSKLVPERLRPEDDARLPEWGFGVTNLIARATPGIGTLRRSEYATGLRGLRQKVGRWRPEVVAFVGVTLYRTIAALESGERALRTPAAAARPIRPGLQPGRFEGAEVFVLPNPSGRNANYSYRAMRRAFAGLRRHLDR